MRGYLVGLLFLIGIISAGNVHEHKLVSKYETVLHDGEQECSSSISIGGGWEKNLKDTVKDLFNKAKAKAKCKLNFKSKIKNFFDDFFDKFRKTQNLEVSEKTKVDQFIQFFIGKQPFIHEEKTHSSLWEGKNDNAKLVYNAWTRATLKCLKKNALVGKMKGKPNLKKCRGENCGCKKLVLHKGPHEKKNNDKNIPTNHARVFFQIQMPSSGKTVCFSADQAMKKCFEKEQSLAQSQWYHRKIKKIYSDLGEQRIKSKRARSANKGKSVPRPADSPQISLTNAVRFGFVEVMKSHGGWARKNLYESQEYLSKQIDEQLEIRNLKENVIYSPTSIYNLLMGLYIGTNENSASMTEQWKLLGRISTVPKSIVEKIEHFNKPLDGRLKQYIYTTKKLTNDYQNDVKKLGYDVKNYTSLVGREKQVNAQVSKDTRKMIKNLFNNGDFSNAVLVIFNTIYFKEAWKDTFEKSVTRSMPFIEKDTMFMGNKDKRKMKITFDYDTGRTFLQLPFKKSGNREQTFMSIVTGDLTEGGFNKTRSDSNPDIYNFANVQLSDIKAKFKDPKVRSQDIDFWMPKFEYDYELKIQEVLADLGLSLIFQDGGADLDRMLQRYAGESVGKIVHKAAVKVDEEGATAAAASGATVVGRTVSSPTVLNQPFKFFIHDKYYNIAMFIGNVNCPAKKAKSMTDCM